MELGKKNKKIQTFYRSLVRVLSKLSKLDNRCKISSDLRIEGTRIHIWIRLLMYQKFHISMNLRTNFGIMSKL